MCLCAGLLAAHSANAFLCLLSRPSNKSFGRPLPPPVVMPLYQVPAVPPVMARPARTAPTAFTGQGPYRWRPLERQTPPR